MKRALSNSNAAVTPAGSTADTESPVFNPATIREFTPSFDVSSQVRVLAWVALPEAKLTRLAVWRERLQS